MADERFSLTLTLPNLAAAQSRINNYNSFCQIGDVFVGCNEDGFYRIHYGSDNDGTNISAYFKLPRTDLGVDKQVKLRALYTKGEFAGQQQVTIVADETASFVFTIDPPLSGMVQQTVRTPLTKALRGSFFDFKFENIDGNDFSYDKIWVVGVILHGKPKGH